jgi:tRNA dimethylallyltransferase
LESKVIVLVGPTCSGKTDLSLLLAKKMKVEIISADSRQVYKYLNIGTAKPSINELSQAKHHLIDFLDPKEEYNASKFEKDSLSIITTLLENDTTPIVAGGSGLYIKALVDGIFDSVDTDEEFRKQVMADRKKFGNQYLYDLLEKVDSKSAANLLPQNWKRVIRALEVFHITGEPIWQHQASHKRDVEFEFMQFGLNWEREVLYSNIESRVDKMIELGLVEEVKSLLENGYHADFNSLNTVGYKEIIEYINDKISLERAIELIKRNTRRYAKRQLTWFRKDERIKWFDISDINDFDGVSEEIINLNLQKSK